MPQVEAAEVAKVAECVVGVCQQGEVFAFGQPQHGLFCFELDFIGLFCESTAGPVSASLYLKGQWLLFASQTCGSVIGQPLAAVQVEPVFGICEVVLVVEVDSDYFIVEGGVGGVGVDIYI